MSSLRRLPAVLWLPVYLGSIFVLIGTHKRNLLIVGLASLLLACCGALYLALHREHAIAALLAGVIPTTAVAIVIATARAKIEESDGRPQDTNLADDEPLPGLGLDDATPLGDHPEIHDDMTPLSTCGWSIPGPTSWCARR
jgi:hypothetical protein